jgi:hypothetical protein
VAKVRPQVIDDEEHERIYERVAAVDVAKDSGMVCARTPHPSRPGGRQSTVWTVKARRNAIAKLGRQLSQDGIEMVTLESTSDYWRIWLRREAPCCIPGLAGRNLEDIPGSDGLLKIRKVKGDNSMPANQRPCRRVRAERWEDPRDMAKAKLPEP